jgi:hypothetical protein
LLNEESLNFYEHDNLIEIPNEFIIKNKKQHTDIPNCPKFELIVEWKNSYIAANMDKFFDLQEQSIKDKKILFDIGLNEIKDFYPDLDSYIKSNYKTLLKDEDLKKLEGLGNIDLNSIYQYFDNYPPSMNANYHHLAKANIDIILLNSSNEDFHNHCITHEINIDCLLLNRPMDNFCNDVNFVNTLKIKEGVVGPNYTSHPKESLTISDIVWESPIDFPDSTNDIVAFIKYQ